MEDFDQNELSGMFKFRSMCGEAKWRKEKGIQESFTTSNPNGGKNDSL